ncbi:MAG: hypothetical protein GY870_02640 [archaeon]|nr:hypothetical protein [archaeon]
MFVSEDYSRYLKKKSRKAPDCPSFFFTYCVVCGKLSTRTEEFYFKCEKCDATLCMTCAKSHTKEICDEIEEFHREALLSN